MVSSVEPSIASLQAGLWRMAYSVWFQRYAISYQPYANFARLASEIFLSSLQSEFFSNLLKIPPWSSFDKGGICPMIEMSPH
jgi:hypothetical protein